MKMKNICSGIAIASVAACMTVVSAHSATTTSAVTPVSSTIQSVLDNPTSYMKKTIQLNGKVERVIDNSSFVMSSNSDSNQRILVMTAVPSSASTTMPKQSAGVAANSGPTLKDNQKVQVTGKFDVLVAKSETDAYNPSQDTASFSEMTTRTPVIIVQPNQIHLTTQPLS